MLHQQVVGSSEHQIRLSKGVTAKFVLRKELTTAKSRLAFEKAAGWMLSLELKKPPLRWLVGSCGVAVLFLYFQTSKLNGVIWQVFRLPVKVIPESELHGRDERRRRGARVAALHLLERILVVR